MAYEKQDWNKFVWKNGQENFQDMLNHMEDGIANAGQGGSDSLWEKGEGEDSIQQKNTLCEATGNQSVAIGLNTHSGATASHSEGALTATRNDYDEVTETGFDAAYSHVEGLNNGVNNVAEHGEGKYGWSYYVDNHDPAKSSIHYVGVGTNNQEQYRKNAEVIMCNGDKYVLGVGGYDGKNIEGAQTVQQVLSGTSSGLITVVKDLDLIADVTEQEGAEIINYFHTNILSSLFPTDFNTAHDRYNLIVKIYGTSIDPEYNTKNTLGYTANHFCYMFDTNKNGTVDFMQYMCYDAIGIDAGISHTTTLGISMGDTYELIYEGKVGSDTALPKEGSKVSIFLQKLY